MCIMFQSMLTMLVQRDWKLVSCTYDPELLKMQHNSVIGHISNAKCTTARHFLIFSKVPQPFLSTNLFAEGKKIC